MRDEQTNGFGDDPVSGASTAWTLVQVGALLRDADDLLLDGLRTIGPEAHAGLADDAIVALDADQVDALRATLDALADAADRLQVLGDGLPDGPVEVRYDDLRTGAADDLAAGIAEPGRAQLAARTLDLADGWRALAEALRGSDAHADWVELTPAQLLRRFRGADAALVRRALDEARLDAETSFADCSPEHLDALAEVLDAYAAGRR